LLLWRTGDRPDNDATREAFRLLDRPIPKLQRASTRDPSEIIVGGKHRQVVSHAKLSQKRVDRSNLNSGSPTAVSQLGRLHVNVAVWDDEGQGRKTIQDLQASLGTRKSLQKLLKHEAGREDCFAQFNRSDEGRDLRRRSKRIAPQRQRPDTGIDKEAQSRVRPAL
jgi:hypothetical protein